MKIVSPIDRGDLVCTSMFRGVPILRELFYGTEWRRYFRSIQKQIDERGKIQESVWDTEERLQVAKSIEKALNGICWGDHFTFHPDDPFYVIGEFEIGDLSELEVVMEIEEIFKIKIEPEELLGILSSKATFGMFVDYIVSKTRN